MHPNVLIAEPLDPVCVNWLAGRARVIQCQLEQDEFFHHLSLAEGLVVRTYTQVNSEILERASALRVVGRAGVGLDNLDLGACRKRGIQVVYTPAANTQAVVEYVLGLVLDDLRPRCTLTGPIDDETFHRHRRELVGMQFSDMTLGILGFGRIGKRLGGAAHALGVRILVNDLLPENALRKDVDYPFDYVDKPHLYRGCDILSIHVDGRPENRHLVNAEALAQLKTNCLLVNAARGFLIDNQALAAWARSVANRNGRAVLDVHDPEPIPPDYPLFGLPNIRLLPHLAARTKPALRNMSWVVTDIVEVLEGRPPKYPA